MDQKEIRLRCIEAAVKNPVPHPDGYAAGILSAAQQYSDWVTHGGENSVKRQVAEIKVGDLL